jgi:small subunit ribosomal protein S8
MSVIDPIGDMLTRIRNAVLAGHTTVALPSSKKMLRIRLKYIGERRERRPVISGLERVSRPGRRVYTGKQEIPWVLSGLGVAILSTPKGVMTGQRARQLGVGGEVLCKVW